MGLKSGSNFGISIKPRPFGGLYDVAQCRCHHAQRSAMQRPRRNDLAT